MDASELAYISSAGLRVLMKLRKQLGKALPVMNVSPEVYDIFDMTGFTELLEVHKALRQLSVEGLPVICAGATAKVYRMDRETMVKVFNPHTSIQIIQQENERSKNAFLNGIPTAISYDMVKVGDSYGSVYELLDAQDFLTILENDKAHQDAHIQKFARAIKTMHQIEVDPVRFPPDARKRWPRIPWSIVRHLAIRAGRLIWTSKPSETLGRSKVSSETMTNLIIRWYSSARRSVIPRSA